jgi:AcrR family transcriptional regulator
MTTTRSSRTRSRRRPPRRTRLSPPEVRARLYGEALSSFRDRGFDDVTVSELTRVTGVAKGTFFNHFPTKDHVLSAYLEELWTEAEAEVAGEGLMGTDAIVRVVDALGRALEADPPLARALGSRLGALPRPSEAAGETPDGTSHGGPDPFLDLLRDRFQRRLGESLPFAVPLEPIGDRDLASLLVGGMVEGIREGTEVGGEAPPTLVPTLARRAVFLLRSAGFAAPDPPGR